MKLNDFKIGQQFIASAGLPWLCTDKGTRTITAIMLEPHKDMSWFVGPPYVVDEVVFDEHDMLACHIDIENILLDRVKNKISCHPAFLSEDVFKMLKDKNYSYHRKNILKKDRVSGDGGIIHPYSAKLTNKGWYIKTFELFSREYSEVHENDFIKFPIATEKSMKSRKKKLNIK